MINNYQFVFITEEGADSVIKKIESTIKSMDGTVVKKETWGKKTFAYPINKKIHGHYSDWVIEVPNLRLKELSNLLNLNTDLVRYLIIRNNK